MRRLKKTLSLCLMLSVICTSLVFTGAGTAYAASNQWTDDITPSDNIADVVPEAGDVIWLEADVTPLATGSSGKGYYGLGFRVGDNNTGRRTLGFYSNNYSAVDSQNGLYIMFQDNNGTPGKLKVATINEKAHVALKQEYGDTAYAVTSVYVNGVAVKTHTGTGSRTQYVYPNKGETLKAVVQRCGFTEDEKAFSNVKSYLNPTDEENLFANFTDLVEDDGYVVTTGEGTAAEDLSWNSTTEWYTTVDKTTSPGFTNFGITCPEGTKWNELLEKLDKGTAAAKINDEDVTDTDTRELADGDKITLTSAKGTLTNTYTVEIPMPIRITSLESSYEYGEFTEIKAELGDEVGTVGPENLKLYIDDVEITDADCNIAGKNVTFTNFDCGVGEHTILVEVTGVTGGPYSKTATTTVTLAEPLTLNVSSSMDYSKLKSISVKLSSYFDADAVEAAKLYFDNIEQTEANWSTDGDVITFTNLAPSLGAVNIKAEIIYDGNSYSDTAAVNIAEYKLSGTAASKGWYYYSYAGKVMEGAIKTEEQGGDAKFTYTFGSSWSNFKNKQETQATIHPRLLIGNSEATAPAADERVYKVVFPFKLKGDTSITPQLTFGGSTIDFVTISTADGGASYNATYGTDGILTDGLIPDTKYTFELTVNHDMYLADYKIIAEDGTEYSVSDVSIDNTIGSKSLDDLRFALTFGAEQGPISLGKPELFYGKEVKYVDEEAYGFDDSELSLSFASAPILSEGESITDYIEVYDAKGNELYVYDAQVLNNEIKLMSNEICRGETYTIKVAPELTFGIDELGKELKLSVDVPLEQFDVVGVDVAKTSTKADITASLQNLETGTGTKDITMIVNITEVQNGNKVTKKVYLKTFQIPYGSASFDAVYNNIPLESGQQVKIFFADGTSSFGAVSNRIFEY